MQQYSNRSGISLECSTNEDSIANELQILTIPIPQQSVINQINQHLVYTASVQKLIAYCQNINLEFLTLQRQKEAHFAFAFYVLAYYSKMQAYMEMNMWDELITQLDMMPDDETLFDLPL